MFKVLHTADLHISNKAEKLEEVERCCNFMADKAAQEKPDLIVLAGDSMDEMDGPIKIDSPAARYAIELVKKLAGIAPVAIVRGTKSHDKETPYLFQELGTKFPVYVAQQIEMVALVKHKDEIRFDVLHEWDYDPDEFMAVLSFFPSPDKSHMVAMSGRKDIQSINLEARELLGDAMVFIGTMNSALSAPKIMVAHGTITGCQFSDSSGNGAIGEDFEFSPLDIQKAGCDLVCFGHIHKQQSFPGNIHYSGSPGRLSFGEKEEKGFLIHEIEAGNVTTRNIPTPARHFRFFDYDWQDGSDGFEQDMFIFLNSGIDGADVRIRVKLPEENRHEVDRDWLIEQATLKGAAKVKVELSVIPKTRQRAAGISQLEGLPAKVKRWGETVGEDIPESVLQLAATIEGLEVEDLLEMTEGKAPAMAEEQAA